MHHDNEDYWYNHWHLDIELHKLMNIRKVTRIEKPEEVSIYADTDSCEGSSIIRTDKGEISISDWYDDNIKNGSGGVTLTGHESVITNDKILNYSNDNLEYTSVKRIIRHRVSKPKWKLKTKSGKEIVVTNDHSMIVFRNGEKIEVKPSEILQTDKILILKNNIC
jgi:Intein splicing domain